MSTAYRVRVNVLKECGLSPRIVSGLSPRSKERDSAQLDSLVGLQFGVQGFWVHEGSGSGLGSGSGFRVQVSGSGTSGFRLARVGVG